MTRGEFCDHFPLTVRPATKPLREFAELVCRRSGNLNDVIYRRAKYSLRMGFGPICYPRQSVLICCR
jgi:hypothetical protein